MKYLGNFLICLLCLAVCSWGSTSDFWFEDAADRDFADGCRSGGEHWGNPIDDRMWGETGPSWNLIGAGGLLSTAASLGKFFEGIGANVYFESSEQAEKYKKFKRGID